MFSWITGPRITNVIEDLQPESNYESTFIDQPETPAHHFPVKAFKQAIFGTPGPDDAKNATKPTERRARLDAANARSLELLPSSDDALPFSPSKQPGGILMTPGTTSRGRKTVSFGSQVVDNEGKRGNIGKSGIPNDCPGKFPSPWTPGTQLQLDTNSDQRPRTKLTEAFLDARTTTQKESAQKPKAKDDTDITIDLGAPRSESGKYWKGQYESYAEKSEKEMKKVIARQQLAKKFAMKKDGEVTELATKLEQERKRSKQRERDLEQQNKDLQERLRKAVAENMSATVEIATLKARLANLEKTNQSKTSFEIYEDASKETVQAKEDVKMGTEPSFAPSLSMNSSGKENSSPYKPRQQRRQTMPEGIPHRSIDRPRLGTGDGEASLLLAKPPRTGQAADESIRGIEEPLATSQLEKAYKSPFNTQRPSTNPSLAAPKSPTAILPSSPLPMPSPDPWMELTQASIPPMDKMAMPVTSGQPYSRPEWNPLPKHQRASKSISHTQGTESSNTNRSHRLSTTEAKKAVEQADRKHQDTFSKPQVSVKPGSRAVDSHVQHRTQGAKNIDLSINQTSTDPRFDVSRITTHHAEGSLQVTKDRVELPQADRKAQARQRLEERRKLKKAAPV